MDLATGLGFLIPKTTKEEVGFPSGYEAYEKLLEEKDLNQHVSGGTFRKKIDEFDKEMDKIEMDRRKEEILSWRKPHDIPKMLYLHRVTSFLAACYIWQDYDVNPSDFLPACIAVPLWHVSKQLRIEPIISYPSMILANWHLKDGKTEMMPENMEVIHTTPGVGADWFILVHAAIEAQFGECLKYILELTTNECELDTEKCTQCLRLVDASLKKMLKVFREIKKKVTPHKFYHELRHFYSGWDNSPLKDGIVYKGISDQKYKCRGGSAAQSTILPVLDGLLHIVHGKEQKEFLEEVKKYMLPEHREVISLVREKCNLRKFVKNEQNTNLTELFEGCVKSLLSFRTFHMAIVQEFISDVAKTDRSEENKSLQETGTGGADIRSFLEGATNSTREGRFKNKKEKDIQEGYSLWIFFGIAICFAAYQLFFKAEHNV